MLRLMSRPQTLRPLCKATYIMPGCYNNLWFGFQTKILTRTNSAYTCSAMFWSRELRWPTMLMHKFFNSLPQSCSHGERCRCARARHFLHSLPQKCIDSTIQLRPDRTMECRSSQQMLNPSNLKHGVNQSTTWTTVSRGKI